MAAKLQEKVSLRREAVGLYKEIAAQLPLRDGGRVLDVGTGTGLQLRAIQAREPGIALYGLDLSAAAIEVARKHLAEMEVDLRQGSIESTSYEAGVFDVVTCNSSMSYWENPVACFDEIHRILKPGGTAILFEPQKEIDLDEVAETIRANLAGESRLRQWAAVSMNTLGLRWGRRLGLKLRSIEELEALVMRSRFGESHRIERVALQNLPIFARITLTKAGEHAPEG
jgi:ubiquinone/menaquinone biosynthesis C-methylase UbiE